MQYHQNYSFADRWERIFCKEYLTCMYLSLLLSLLEKEF